MFYGNKPVGLKEIACVSFLFWNNKQLNIKKCKSIHIMLFKPSFSLKFEESHPKISLYLIFFFCYSLF